MPLEKGASCGCRSALHSKSYDSRSLEVIEKKTNSSQTNRILITGGEGGIRTHGTRKGSTVFETARFNRSRTSPAWIIISGDPRFNFDPHWPPSKRREVEERMSSP